MVWDMADDAGILCIGTQWPAHHNHLEGFKNSGFWIALRPAETCIVTQESICIFQPILLCSQLFEPFLGQRDVRNIFYIT